MFEIGVIALVVIAFILYSSKKKENDSDFLSIELFNLEKELETIKRDVELLEFSNKEIANKLAIAKKYNDYIHHSRQHHLFDVLDVFIKQGYNLKDEK